MSFGKVYLVGAGPGDPDLLTLRAVEVLKRADVLLYDRLANPEVMRYAPPTAQRVYVGKDKGKGSASRQSRIHTLMIGHARAGKTVVRLKGGDPFVFGRGGEELLQLKQAGIEVEMVPGISSCISAPASAFIPVTFRGLANSFGVFTAHPGDGQPEIDWEAAARMETAVFLMGVARLPRIAAKLQAHGKEPDTPVAIIEKAFQEGARTVTGTLADITEKAQGIQSPATIIVGSVVNVHTSFTARDQAVQNECAS